MKFEELNLLEVGHSIQLAGAVYRSPNQLLLVLFPDELNDVCLESLEMNLDQWQQFLRQTDLLETEILTKDANGQVVKAIVRKCQRQIDQHVSWRVFKRDGYKCRYCGSDSVPLTVDHLVLWEEFGSSVDSNLVSACRKCNKARGNMQYQAWLQSPFYQRASRGLARDVKDANAALAGTLDSIPRTVNTRSR